MNIFGTLIRTSNNKLPSSFHYHTCKMRPHLNFQKPPKPPKTSQNFISKFEPMELSITMLNSNSSFIYDSFKPKPRQDLKSLIYIRLRQSQRLLIEFNLFFVYKAEERVEILLRLDICKE